jgi:hypothetical protein
MKRRSVLLGSGLALTGPLLTPLPPPLLTPASRKPLADLAHLDFLRSSVDPPEQAGHRTYGSGPIGVLWTYAEPGPGGTYRRIGGGPYDTASDTYGQGAYNSDDIARAAVVYLRHWRQTGSAASRDASQALLRGLTYLQSGNGNFVLWMQPDGTLHPSALPPELPDPSDSGPSYWTARAVWALGEGYAAWRTAAPAFAAFLRQRLDRAVGALSREVLTRYGTWQNVDGTRTPAWLIVDGADATAEAVLGLVAAGGYAPVVRRFAAGIAALSAGDARTWPFGAVRPWALSLSDWHAWASQMPAALAAASSAAASSSAAGSLLDAAVRDAAVFTPWMLTSGGPDNGRLPTRIDTSQIAYGVDSRLQSLLAVASATGRDGFRTLAGIVASWYFGANAAGVPAYDPSTGRTVDGIAGDGTVNRNAGAESTIHGLLSMLALDADPAVAAIASQGHVIARVGTTTVDAATGAGAIVVTPPSAWTGESRYSDGTYVRIPAGASVRWTLPPLDQPHLVLPVADLRPGSPAVTGWSSGGRSLGSVRHGRIGPQGTSPAPGALLPVTLPSPLSSPDLVATASGGEALVDAVMLEPLVSRYTIGAGSHTTTLLRSAATTARTASVGVPGKATIEVYDTKGVRRGRTTAAGPTVRAPILPGGFTVVRT